MRKTNGKLDQDVDELFRLPLSEFIGARKTLAARLKKDGRADESDYVKTLAKPSVTAWTVNQLYWHHRDAFDELIRSGQRFRKAQTSRSAGKIADMRGALDTRREALSHLSDLATSLLHDAGHNPTLDTIRRITTTLEALSAYALLPDGPTPGRLIKDVDPPGFEMLTSLMPGGAVMTHRREQSAPPTPSRKSLTTATKLREMVTRVEETRQTRIAEAKTTLQDAKTSLAEARANAQRLQAAQKKTDAETKEAEKRRREAEIQRREAQKQMRDAEERFKKASRTADDASRRARDLRIETQAATKALEDAKRSVETATKELETLFRESTNR